MANNRIFHAVHVPAFANDGSSSFVGAHGVQTCTMSLNFGLQNVQQLGTLEPYEIVESVPEVELSMTKVLDGYPLLFHLATAGTTTTSPDLNGRANTKCQVAVGIYNDTSSSADGVPVAEVLQSGLFVSNFKLTIPVDGNMTEEISLQGNHRVWKSDPRVVSSDAYGTAKINNTANTYAGDSPKASGGNSLGGVQRRENILFEKASSSGLDVNGMFAGKDTTVLPPEVFGISASGTNEYSNGAYGAAIQTISVSASLNREPLYELGHRGSYARSLQYPVEVSTEIEIIAKSGDYISATEGGIYTTGTSMCEDRGNIQDRTIRIATCDGTRIYTGRKNKLMSVNYNGGDATGGNVTVSYQFTNYNVLTVMHVNDPHASGSAWWAIRDTYLQNL